jgi:type I restriction enzyme M protein
VKRDADYYDFKPEIDTKDTIRKAVGDVDAKVITQLERWWNKYRVSLDELDAQVNEAESVMKGYLVELGYE